MRIAVSGAHGTGKTSLITELAAHWPGVQLVDEPYYLLEEEGHAFGATPNLDDFELQLDRAVRSLRETEGHGVFDRCPLDVLAYLTVVSEPVVYDARAWMPELRSVLSTLTSIIFVPIESPDRINRGAASHRRLRQRVDRVLRDVLIEDSWGFGVPVLEVSGSSADRASQVVAHLSRQAGRG